jgi:type I restriction-modification system DNA methylase subunit
MTIQGARFQELLSQFKLEQLFNELGWDKPTLKPQTVSVNGESFALTQIAHKRGVAVFRCSPDTAGRVPPRPTLLKIEQEARKLAHEHLLIFADANETMLTWLWVLRIPGQPISTRTHTWHKGQSGESLRQKLSQIIWSLEAEEAITLTDVITGLRRAFDRDKVSKSFYDKFKAQHDTFAEFISGLKEATDQAWYASLMLNRLMFVYFIQKKGFLDGDENYLSNRMAQVQKTAGKGKFHNFYRQFLRRLFHEGLGQPKANRDSALAKLIGDVPYLNGGLFDVHELEEANPGIDVPDEAFEQLFAFFDAWDWHLDDRPLKSGREINPDVLGYIFEKYINQKQMGAYYTKEDITEYISKSTVIPFLLEQARERCKVAFDSESSVWNLLSADPDRYIYPAMKAGVIDTSGQLVPEAALPDFVQIGMKDAKARMFDKRYNLGEAAFHTATGERGTLPTETWREYVERRQRCLSIRERLANGGIRCADDLITLNLDIRQFMQDVIDNCTGADLLRALWQAIVGRLPEKSNEKFRHGITILDPTCGSGAFLFAALSILEPLYEACLDRMEDFVEDAKKLGKPGEADFIKVLAEVEKHPSRSYYIYKNIILHNLFGVDIMAEAVEICKLRLFLKLVSQVDSGRELEPLPDIDFNIRTGNTLVGFATEGQFNNSGDLASDTKRKAEIKVSIADLADLFDHFREQQTVKDGKVTAKDKHALRDKLRGLSEELDHYLARDYGMDPDKPKLFKIWQESHQPFHWFAEFYSVMREGGFDVVIGNPPYVEIPKEYNRALLRSLYRTALDRWSRDEDLYTLVTERTLSILKDTGKMGLILPLSLAFSTKKPFVSMRQVMSDEHGHWWWTHYDRIPSALFGNEVRTRCTITILSRHPLAGNARKRFTSALMRWSSEERDILFQTIRYANLHADIAEGIPKIGSDIQAEAYRKLSIAGYRLAEDLRQSISFSSLSAAAPNFPDDSVFVGGVAYNWFPAWRTIPTTTTATGAASLPARTAGFRFSSADDANAVFAMLCSSLGYWWWATASDGFNLKKWLLDRFPLSMRSMPSSAKKELSALGEKLKAALEKQYVYKDNKGRIGNYFLPACQEIVDEIDAFLGKNISALSAEFFLSVRDFNASFSTAQMEGDDAGDEE